MKLIPLAASMALATSLLLVLSSCGSDSSPNSSSNSNGETPKAVDSPAVAIYTKTDHGIPWNSAVAYGTFADPRDSQVYRTVKVGTQTWMAENLNLAGAGACYGNSPDSCSKYGRLYTWAEVMQGAISSTSSPSKVKGLCPAGWHVPSNAEWTLLGNAVGASDSAKGTKFKSVGGWANSGNGADVYGFRALPAGYRAADGSFTSAAQIAYWWSATESDTSSAWYRNMYFSSANLSRFYGTKTFWFSLRCAQD